MTSLIILFRLIKLSIKDSNGNFARQNNHKMKITLFIKPSMLRAYIFVLIIVFVFYQPNPASAGFFSDLVDKIVGNKTQASEVSPINNDVIHNSQNVPLLESSINPDTKNIKDDPIPTISNDTLLSNNGSLGVDYGLEKYASSDKITTYKVKKGDTLDSIAKKLKVPKSTIIASNADLKKSDLLKIGQNLVILAIKTQPDKDKKEEKVKNLSVVNKKVDKPDDTKDEGPVDVINTDLVTVQSQPQTQIPIVNTPVVKQPEEQKPIEPTNTPTGQPTSTINSGYIWPLPEGVGRVSQELHADAAYDFAAPTGTPIYAVQSGTVLISRPSGYNGGYGLYVVINFNDGRQAIFGHMSKVIAKEGQIVKQGDVIGYIGNTGKSTGPHLHLGFHGDLGNPYIGLKVNSTNIQNSD